ncbi:MAG: hypothetical protein IKU36_01240 [Bacteroidales bacterium]|nr:hypothetical protein [Bacteroidales bacterium]
MEKTFTKYTKPEINVIVIETEQTFLVGSNVGWNEGLYEDPNDYSDYFE